MSDAADGPSLFHPKRLKLQGIFLTLLTLEPGICLDGPCCVDRKPRILEVEGHIAQGRGGLVEGVDHRTWKLKGGRIGPSTLAAPRVAEKTLPWREDSYCEGRESVAFASVRNGSGQSDLEIVR